MKTKLVRALVLALVAGSMLLSGTAYAGGGSQPGGLSASTITK
jgi:hypothetical protein